MLIKVGNSAVLNVTEVTSLLIRQESNKVLVTKGGLFKEPTYKEEKFFTIEFNYKDENGSKSQFNLQCKDHTFSQVKEIEAEILSQVKDVELASLSTKLEDAIRKA
jgi:hypothetical protein